jgi:CubicO group peptidase (beta-lactamase class C family)
MKLKLPVMMKTLSAFVLFVLISTVGFSQRQPAFITDSLDKYIAREMAAQNLPGLAIAIVKDGNIIVSKGYGVTETGKSQMVNDSTLFQIASCSKAFTATSLALLSFQKKLSLDDTVKKWMPGFHLYNDYATKEVTIRDLLCHRIGMQTFQGDFLNWNSNLTRAQIIGAMATEKQVYGMRAKFGYCNAAYLTAGEIIPVVTGQSWDTFVKATFFDPLQMTRTSTTHDAIANDKNACKPHTYYQGKLLSFNADNVDNLGPAASINSCAKDLSHWLLMQLDSGRFMKKQIVPFPVLKETRKPQTILDNRSATSHFTMYCLGWFSYDYNGKQVFYHDGGADGFLSTVCFIPELNLGITILVNSDNCTLYGDLRKQVIDAYMQLPYQNYSAVSVARSKKAMKEDEKYIKTLQDSAALKLPLPVAMKAFTGVYINSVYGKMNITTDGGKIAATFEHHPAMLGKLEYIGNNRFLCTFNTSMWGINVAPFVIKDGWVESITINVNPSVDMMPYTFFRFTQERLPDKR